MINWTRQALGRVARRRFAQFVHAVFPQCCVFCGDIGDAECGPVCGACFNDLPWLQNPCPTCALPLGTKPQCRVSCGACQSHPPPYDRCVVALEYSFPVDAAIKALKFYGRLQYAPAFVEVLLAVIGQLPADIDAFLPVPLHRWRLMKRGFNQASELAEPIARKLGMPIIENVVRRYATPYQSGLDARQRQKNLACAFAVRGRIGATHVVIVDDVVTTGETCRRLATELLLNGVEKVSVLALARA